MIKLPDLFAEKLAPNPSLLADVQASFAAFSPWLASSGMPFFPGFTDHSPTHINDVLSSAASLISDSSHDLITPEDVSTLCMAILLHDAGMHLTADSFRSLIGTETPPLTEGFADLPWSQLWKEFLGEAHRFGQEKLLAIFGDSTPLRVDSLDINNLNEKDHLLIGEFVRRHHTRLAHEIALVGIGRDGAQPIKLIGFNDAICDIAGLVARSHGMPIRKTFDYLGKKYGGIAVCRKIKVPYLMAVLRIADYIQVKSERAIAGLLSVKELRSPISRQEWRNHFAISDVHTYHADPEAIFVEAAPVDVRTFSKLSTLFKDIQRELDESWATLGEVYGRMGKLDKLGLNSRRIRSTLDSIEEFAKTVPYIPVAARFDSSGPELLKLLVGPLYDYKLSVGIRELMQNAIDACREAQDLYAKRGLESDQSNVVNVTVEIVEEDDGNGYILISDNGVGMTVETITRYFLIAGASFRNSDVWKRQHTDREGRPKISRGGRFGIGALAAFLLGEEINVTTRHIDRPSHEGITFTARIDDPHVQLTKCTAPQGTSFKVIVKDSNVFDQLRPRFPFSENKSKKIKLATWDVADWFVQNNPSVLVKWAGFDFSRQQAQQLQMNQTRVSGEFSPPEHDLVPSEPLMSHEQWTVLGPIAHYDAILWRYKGSRPQKVGNETVQYYPNNEVIVNGLRVEEISRRGSIVTMPEEEGDFGPRYTIARPSIAIYDPSGICPINLQRSSVAFDRMGIDEDLARQILFHNINDFLKSTSPMKTVGDFYRIAEQFIQIDGLNFIGQIAPIGYVKGHGIIVLDSLVFSRINITKLLILDLSPDDVDVELERISTEELVVVLRMSENYDGTQSRLAWFRGIFGEMDIMYYGRNIGLPKSKTIFQVSLMSENRWTFVSKKSRVARYIIEPLTAKEFSDRMLISRGDASEIAAVEQSLRNYTEVFSPKTEVVMLKMIPASSSITKFSILTKVWAEIAHGDIYRG